MKNLSFLFKFKGKVKRLPHLFYKVLVKPVKPKTKVIKKVEKELTAK